jgi:dihydrodipicolinate synthase/N-acetylneuraminate lyase
VTAPQWDAGLAQPPIVGFMPTAFTSADTVDTLGMERLAGFLACQGIRPAVLGGMGEFYALDRGESRMLMESAVQGAGDIPVVAGIGFSTREAVALSRDAYEAGVSLCVVNPHYYAVPTPVGLAQHVKAVTEASGLPAVLYSSTTHPLTDHHIDLLVEVPGFWGIKEEAHSPEETQERVSRWGDRIEWWGVGEPNGMEYVRIGARVVTSSMANVSPSTSRQYVAARLENRLSHHPELGTFAAAWDSYLANAVEGTQGALKAMMHLRHGWGTGVRGPMCPPGDATLAAAATFLDRFADMLELAGHVG